MTVIKLPIPPHPTPIHPFFSEATLRLGAKTAKLPSPGDQCSEKEVHKTNLSLPGISGLPESVRRAKAGENADSKLSLPGQNSCSPTHLIKCPRKLRAVLSRQGLPWMAGYKNIAPLILCKWMPLLPEETCISGELFV